VKSNSKKRIIQEIVKENENISKKKKIDNLTLFDELIKYEKLEMNNIPNSKTNMTHQKSTKENKKTIEFLFKIRFNLQKINEVINTTILIKKIKDNKNSLSETLSNIEIRNEKPTSKVRTIEIYKYLYTFFL